MPALTVKRVRKIFGKSTDNIPDEEIEQEIKLAELLKVLFFKSHLSGKKISYNKPTNGKA